MATTKTDTPKAKKPAISLDKRVEKMLSQAALQGKLDLDTLSTIEQHVKRLAVFLGAPA